MPMSCTLVRLAQIVLVSSLAATPALAQWTLGLEVGADRFWGGSVETSGDARSFRPYRPTTFGIGLQRQGGRVSPALQVHYAEAGIALEGEGAVAAIEGVFTVVSLSPEVVYRLTKLGPANQLRVHVGPLFEIWGIIDEDSQTRVGLQGAVSLDVPLGGRFAGSVLAGAALIASPFEEGLLGAEFETRALWRRRMAVGLQYRL